MQPDAVANLLIGVLFSVALLVVISLGLAVIFGMLGIINFAHGEFLMIGAFLTLSCTRAGLPIWLAMLVAPFGVGALGVLVERTIIRPLYGRREATMLATFGLSLILVQLAVVIWGTSTQGVETPLSSFRIGSYSISEYRLVVIAVALVLLLVVYLVLTRSRFGVMARAATQLPDMAAGVGVNARMINMGTFAFGAALAGAGGALLAPLAAVTPSMGSAYVARSFMTVVVGGPGVISGTAAASGALGSVQRIVSDLSTAFVGTAALLVVAIVLLRVMPQGLSGRFGWRL
jgi:branched-chain amino acid transport system permease protein